MHTLIDVSGPLPSKAVLRSMFIVHNTSILLCSCTACRTAMLQLHIYISMPCDIITGTSDTFFADKVVAHNT